MYSTMLRESWGCDWLTGKVFVNEQYIHIARRVNITSEVVDCGRFPGVTYINVMRKWHFLEDVTVGAGYSTHQ